MATDYGTGYASISGGAGLDRDPFMRPISGPAVVLQGVARRFVTPRGSLRYAPNVGFDIRNLLLQGVRESDLPMYERLIALEAEADERVLAADVTLTFIASTGQLRCDINLRLAEGVFGMVLKPANDNATIDAILLLTAA